MTDNILTNISTNISTPPARTLAEAHTYLGLQAAAQQAAGSTVDRTATTEGERGWTLTWADRVTVQVEYASEQAARAVGSHYGLGVSRLIDAAQWVLIADTYAERAVAATTGSDGATDGELGGETDAGAEIEADWLAAAEAVDEALKFFAERNDQHRPEQQLPETAVWTDQGRRFAESNPERLTRDRLLDDLEYYRSARADLIARSRGEAAG